MQLKENAKKKDLSDFTLPKLHVTKAKCKKKELSDFVLPKICVTQEKYKKRAQWLDAAKNMCNISKMQKQKLSDFVLLKMRATKAKWKKLIANMLIFSYKICKLWFNFEI